MFFCVLFYSFKTFFFGGHYCQYSMRFDCLNENDTLNDHIK